MNSFERPVNREEGNRLFKEMQEKLANPDFIPEKINAIEIRALAEKPRPKTVIKTKKSQAPTSPAVESGSSKGWLNDWQDRQEAEAERRTGIGSNSPIEIQKELERLAQERRARDSGPSPEQGNN